MTQGKRVQRLAAIPVYRRIEQDIRTKILHGIWPADMLLPSRLKLAEEYGVGLPTIEHAIDLLIENGFIRAESRRGTFVTKDAQVRLMAQANMQVQDLSQEMLLTPFATPRPAVEGLPDRRNAPILGIIAADFPVVPYDKDSLYDWSSRVVRALERAFSLAGGRVHFLQRFTGPDQQLATLEEGMLTLLLNGVEALAIVNVVDIQRVSARVSEFLDTTQIPVVLHGWHTGQSSLPHTSYDSMQAGYQASQHLLQMGYSPLIFLDCWNEWWTAERLRGAQAALQAAGLPDEMFLIRQQDKQEKDHPPSLREGMLVGLTEGRALFKELANGSLARMSGRQPGIIAPTDSIAHGVLQAAVEIDKQAGIDFGLIGFDDIGPSCELGLTSLCPPLEEIGAEMAQQLLRGLRGETIAPYTALQSHLIARTSTDAQPKEARLSALTTTARLEQPHLQSHQFQKDYFDRLKH
ncbi:substrate-binding domain-containing protein [Tengunoibacter tsumagoiensis]|uniref:HTH gntR-type domain-containing protein n=1 Tax=Tengunoibacter tsumagoiensis TaxID=2014871 RepID=A0A402A9N4_9CHLR|nr:substrate-binding domain-containing protein [Tengunoibacter tsumagoiensis]GCE15863.1 hypothetical protein KTT_57220 [Tengunoibacter tsumagoiensis]